MARSMITGKETQKMQEYTQERIAQAERRDIEFSTDVKEQIFEYANLIGEEDGRKQCVWFLIFRSSAIFYFIRSKGMQKRCIR